MTARQRPPPPAAATFADRELDRRISDGAEMIRSALRDHDRAVAQQRQCQKSAVLTAWNLGRLLNEKKAGSITGASAPGLQRSEFRLRAQPII